MDAPTVLSRIIAFVGAILSIAIAGIVSAQPPETHISPIIIFLVGIGVTAIVAAGVYAVADRFVG